MTSRSFVPWSSEDTAKTTFLPPILPTSAVIVDPVRLATRWGSTKSDFIPPISEPRPDSLFLVVLLVRISLSPSKEPGDPTLTGRRESPARPDERRVGETTGYGVARSVAVR